MTRTAARILTPILVAGLLFGGIGLANPRAALGGVSAGRAGATAGALPGAFAALPLLGALPIGTTVEARFYDADPASGAAPLTTLAITVGVDSEAALAEALAAAREAAAGWEAAYLVVATGEIRRTIDLPEADEAVAPRPRGAAAGMRLATAGMATGDAITVELFDADPASGGAPIASLSFVYGVDSAIGFQAAVREALEGAAVAVVTASPRSVTIDLKARSERADGWAERAQGMAARMGRFVERWGAADGRRMAPPSAGRGAPPFAPGMRGDR